MRLKTTVLVILILLFLPFAGCKKKADSELPAVAMKDLNGNTVRLSQFRGKPLIVNFWATWCGPCRIEIPMLNQLFKKYSSSDLIIVGISTDEEGASVVKSFMKDVPIDYPVYLQTDEVEEKFGGIWGLPTTFFFDKNGKQVGKTFGLQPREFFEEKIQQMIRGS